MTSDVKEDTRVPGGNMMITMPVKPRVRAWAANATSVADDDESTRLSGDLTIQRLPYHAEVVTTTDHATATTFLRVPKWVATHDGLRSPLDEHAGFWRAAKKAMVKTDEALQVLPKAVYSTDHSGQDPTEAMTEHVEALLRWLSHLRCPFALRLIFHQHELLSNTTAL
jgi:hypothetical protein